jgi:hypothetical protein
MTEKTKHRTKIFEDFDSMFLVSQDFTSPRLSRFYISKTRLTIFRIYPF